MPFDGTRLDDVTKLLIEAHALIERGWCVLAQAKDERGRECSPRSDRAASWCLYGAIAAAAPNGALRDAAAERVLPFLDGEYWAPFNNRQTSSEPVLAALGRAIANG